MPLTRTDWAEAALLALARDGLKGVAVERLARDLGTTKGSFYWHFADRAELIAATLEHWEHRATTEMIARIHAIDDPRERLAELASTAYAGAARGNAYTAMLAAAADPLVRAALERVTRSQLAFLHELYTDLGVPSDQAARHAHLAFALYLGIGDLRLADPDNAPAGAQLDAYLALAVNAILPPGDAQRAHPGRRRTPTRPDS
jgi:AcrR family transcriptional regulator